MFKLEKKIKEKTMEKIINAEKFRIAKFRFYLKPLEPIILPNYKGSALRGGFGSIFKKTVCINFHKECDSCVLRNKCAYAYIFETPFPQNLIDKTKFKMAYPPHPYIIEPPFNSQLKFNPDDEFTFNLILIGKGIEYFPYFIFVFEELGKHGLGKGKGKYKLVRVEDIKGETIYHSERLKNSFEHITLQDIINQYQQAETKNYSKIKVHFLTPTRIISEEELIRKIDFQKFITYLLRRISLLSVFHCEEQLDFDYFNLLNDTDLIKSGEEQFKWFEWGRYSSKQAHRIRTGGFVGNVSFNGALDKFLPFIKLGEYIHIGKQTSFGLGKYEIMK